MDCWDWEIFDSVVTDEMFAVTDHGPLFGPVTEFKLERDESLHLLLETTSAGDSTSSAPDRPAGTVYRADSEVRLKSFTGSEALAIGVIPRSHRTSWSTRSEQGVKKERSSIQALKWSRGGSTEPSYIIDWVSNIDSFLWPHMDDSIDVGERCRTLKSPTKEMVLSAPTRSQQLGHTCVYLSVEGVDFFVGTSSAKPDHVEKPGFILYCGTPDEATRSKIRDCLSFCLGSYLIYLGCTEFDSQWRPVAFNALSGHALAKDASKLISWQPAPLGTHYETEISPEILERMVSSLCRIYDEFDLESVFWSYWHAIAAPVHMKAIHFGAAIESIQTAYIRNHPAVQTCIVEDVDLWTEIRGKFISCISEAGLSAEAEKLLINKAHTLNRAPQSMVMESFFSALGLEFGVLEKNVWANRNRAAHGGSVGGSNGHRLIRENKILQIMINRILLSLAPGTSDWYFDYYTLGRPIRMLAESIPDDRENGNR